MRSQMELQVGLKKGNNGATVLSNICSSDDFDQ